MMALSCVHERCQCVGAWVWREGQLRQEMDNSNDGSGPEGEEVEWLQRWQQGEI